MTKADKGVVAVATAKPLPGWVNFVTAGTGGIMGWCVVHPFNTLSVRMNLVTFDITAQSTGPKKAPPFFSFASHIIREEGINVLYKGLSAGIVRQIFYSTSIFGCFELFRDHYAQYFTSTGGNGEITLVGRLISGLGSGLVAACLSCPAEVALVRMSNDLAQSIHKRRNYRHVGEAFARIAKEEGISGFFRGVGPFANRAVVVGAVQIGLYDQIRQWFRSPPSPILQPLATKSEVMNAFYSSMCAGLIYSTLTMPFETAKNRMAFQRVDPLTGERPYRSALHAIRRVVQTEGVLSLWTGFAPYYLRCGLHTVVMFNSIEWLRRLYRENNM